MTVKEFIGTLESSDRLRIIEGKAEVYVGYLAAFKPFADHEISEEYVERVTKAGNTIEIERYFTSRYKKKGISRGDKVKPTKEEQEKVNTRQAERKLRILINANYGYGDYHLVLDYIRRKGQPDRTPEQMRQDIDVFLRECRKEYRKAGLEFKYIHVMEIGKKGARHHHLVVNKIDTEILQRCWYKAYEGHNRVKVFPLDDSGNYAELASYLIKYTGTHKKGTDGALQGKAEAEARGQQLPESDGFMNIPEGADEELPFN